MMSNIHQPAAKTFQAILEPFDTLIHAANQLTGFIQ